MHDEDAEIIECRECGARFDLTEQVYYDNLCPRCMDEENPERNWPVCAECDERIPPDEQASKTVKGARRDPATVRLPVHEDCKTDGAGRTFRGP